MRHTIFILFIFVIMSNTTDAQNKPAKPCTSSECSQFDFWLGDWELTYSDTLYAENRITKEMDGCLIHEHFHDPNANYFGESWSIYNPQKKIWQQTWVDNQAGYIVLTGAFKDGKMVLMTEPATQPDGKKKISRMVYYNITANTLDWDWEATTDDGKTWVLGWRLHYKRKQK